MSNWKLPEHLEPYREELQSIFVYSIESLMNGNHGDLIKIDVERMIDLLQNLYDAGKLK